MDEILDNFEFGIDEYKDSEEISQIYNLCLAKLEALLATKRKICIFFNSMMKIRLK